MSKDRVAILTGGSGFLGQSLIDGLAVNHSKIYIVDKENLEKNTKNTTNVEIVFNKIDISNENDVIKFFEFIHKEKDIPLTLLNAAANNPELTSKGMQNSKGFEFFDTTSFSSSVTDSLLGTALMCREFVKFNANNLNDEKIILNIGSDLSVIAPDNRIYGKDQEGDQIFKPIEYSISKHGVVGLTKYLSVYLANKNYRVNTFSPTGVFNDQNEEFVKKFSETVPLNRMLDSQEISSHIAYLTSDDSSFLTGQNIVVDGGRSIW
jgi:NAD(P)-dependent dehydrogenase (short-subunit alcohol dehydrogenase family)